MGMTWKLKLVRIAFGLALVSTMGLALAADWADDLLAYFF
jgi:hypothetical protein